MSSHTYLRFTDTAGGIKVGSSDWGGGLLDPSVKVIQIPQTFGSKEVVEIAYTAFGGTYIESVFIPRTVTYLNTGAFLECKFLKEVRFESGSKLQKMDYNVFYGCTSLEKIDIPSTLQIIISSQGNCIFRYAAKLTCVSYLGSIDFSASNLFEGSSPSVHVSPSYPQNKRFGEITPITRNGESCGVSQLPFYHVFPTTTTISKPTNLHVKQSSFLLQFLIFANGKGNT